MLVCVVVVVVCLSFEPLAAFLSIRNFTRIGGVFLIWVKRGTNRQIDRHRKDDANAMVFDDGPDDDGYDAGL